MSFIVAARSCKRISTYERDLRKLHFFCADETLFQKIDAYFDQGIDAKNQLLSIQHRTQQTQNIATILRLCYNIAAMLLQYFVLGGNIAAMLLQYFVLGGNIAAMLLQYFVLDGNIAAILREYCNVVVMLQRHCNIAAILLQCSIFYGLQNTYSISVHRNFCSSFWLQILKLDIVK